MRQKFKFTILVNHYEGYEKVWNYLNKQFNTNLEIYDDEGLTKIFTKTRKDGWKMKIYLIPRREYKIKFVLYP